MEAIVNINDSLILVDTFFASALFLFLTLLPPDVRATFAVTSLCCFVLSLFMSFWSKVCIHFHPFAHVDLSRLRQCDGFVDAELGPVRRYHPCVYCLMRVFDPPKYLILGVALMLTGMCFFLFGVVCPSLTGNHALVCYSLSGFTAAPVVLFLTTAVCVRYCIHRYMFDTLMLIRLFVTQNDDKLNSYPVPLPLHNPFVGPSPVAMDVSRFGRTQQEFTVEFDRFLQGQSPHPDSHPPKKWLRWWLPFSPKRERAAQLPIV